MRGLGKSYQISIATTNRPGRFPPLDAKCRVAFSAVAHSVPGGDEFLVLAHLGAQFLAAETVEQLLERGRVADGSWSCFQYQELPLPGSSPHQEGFISWWSTMMKGCVLRF